MQSEQGSSRLSDKVSLNSRSLQSETLCVDFDGTFIRTDSLHELLLRGVVSGSISAFSLVRGLLGGKAHFKEMVWRAAGRDFRYDLLPRTPEVEAFIQDARSQGKRVELVSAAHQDLLDSFPALREQFDAVIGTSAHTNLGGRAKGDFLVARHPDGFAYIGNASADLPVWAAARERYGVNMSSWTRSKAAALDVIALDQPRSFLKPLLKGMRVHQWSKNTLLFVPLALGLARLDAFMVLSFILGFILFGLMASGTYLLNDLVDIDADRAHPKKRFRPFASARLPIALGGPIAIALIVTGILGSFLVNTSFGTVTLVYFLVTLAYSMRLKKIVLIDVFTIAALFTLRIIGGVALLGPGDAGQTAHWLLNFSGFLFASMAFMKRETELNSIVEQGLERSAGRDYRASDQPLIMMIGVGLGIASLIIFALFISSIETGGSSQYSRPEMLWIAHTAIAYWLMRLWLKTQRGQMKDDPIVFALKDPASLSVIAIVGLSAILSQVL